MTNYAINHNKSEFMKVLNNSYRTGCLQCSFNDKELVEFFMGKKRSLIADNHDILDRPWVLNEEVCTFVSSDGKMLELSETAYVWIHDVFTND